MRKYGYQIIWVIVILLLLPKNNFAQVKKITAETNDGLKITVWINENPSFGTNVKISYKIKNTRSKMIYLVRKKSLEFEISEDTITVNSFTVGFNEYGDIDYSFIPIKRGKILSGTFLFSLKNIKREGIWYVNVGLAFISNIRDLQPKSYTVMRDPAAFRGKIAQRAIPIIIGSLYLEV